MKRTGLILALLLAMGGSAFAQSPYSYNFINTGTNGPGVSFANTGITAFSLNWSPQSSVLTCVVQVDSSADNVTWGSGDLIASQSCTSAGFVAATSLASGKNFVRVHVIALTGNGGLNVTLTGSGGSGGGASPSSLTTFFGKFMGPSPNDCGNAGCTSSVGGAFGDFKACYDYNISGQPTANITSSSTFTLTNSALTSNVATYTFTNSNGGTVPVITVGQTLSVTGSNNANGALNITNAPVVSATSTAVTVNFTHANVASAADTGTIATVGAGNVGCHNFQTLFDVGKVIEVKGIGAAAALLSTTILSVQSPTQATLAANATTNATLQKGWSCHDDTTPLQNWAAAISNGFPSGFSLAGTTFVSHGGYLAGLYCTTKPIRIDNPLGNPGFTGNSGDGTPEPFSNNNAASSPSIWGAGPYRNGIVPLSTFVWPTTSSNQAVFYSRNWNGPTYWNFGVIFPDQSIAYNTTGVTGEVAGFMTDQDAHSSMVGLQVENANNTTGTLVGWELVGGGYYNAKLDDSQMYNNNYNGKLLSANNTGAAIGMDAIHIRNTQFAGPTGAAGSSGNFIVDAVGAGQAHYKGLSFEDVEFSSCDGNSTWGNSEIVFRTNVIVDDEVQISNSRICNNGTANGFGVTELGTVNPVNVSLTNVDINQAPATNNAAFSPVFIQGSATRFKVFGGAWGHGAASLTNLGSIATGSRIYVHGTTNNTGATAFAGTGATNGVWTCFETAASCSGPGNLGSSSYTFAGTQTLPTGTGACATITTNTGGASGGQATCTGTTGASTFIITPGSTAAHGWVCFGNDQTTAANTLRQSANSPTTCTIAGTVNANDVLTFGAFAY